MTTTSELRAAILDRTGEDYPLLGVLVDFEKAVRAEALDILTKHIPSITDSVEEILNKRAMAYAFSPATGEEGDVADLALRRCHCGVLVDGYYEYVAHLEEVLREQTR